MFLVGDKHPEKQGVNFDEFVKSLFFTTEHTESTEKFFSLRLVNSVTSVCSVVNFKFLRNHQL